LTGLFYENMPVEMVKATQAFREFTLSIATFCDFMNII